MGLLPVFQELDHWEIHCFPITTAPAAQSIDQLETGQESDAHRLGAAAAPGHYIPARICQDVFKSCINVGGYQIGSVFVPCRRRED